MFCGCFLSEDRFGKDGRARAPEPLHLDLPGGIHWLELETLYRLDERAYDLKLNFNVSLEDWANFGGAVDTMFALLGNFNHAGRYHHSHRGVHGGDRGGGQTLVSSTGQSASAIYLTTLATPALLLREAGVETLRTALGLSQGAPSPSSPAALPEDEVNVDWAHPLSLLNELLEEEEEDEEEAEPHPYRQRSNSTPCDCTNFSPEETFGAAI